jgi:capsular polysaccharide biosynthesis protein
MEYNFESRKLMLVVKKWKYHLLVVLVVATAVAALFSGPGFIVPMYKSYAVVYPDNLKTYSKESTTEQMMQVFQSQGIVDSMIAQFDLAKRYDIDPDYKYFRTAELELYHENVSIRKTSFEAVEIEVLDRNPDTAKLMVDRLIALFNRKVRKMQKEKFGEMADAYAGTLKRKRASMDSLRNILQNLGKKGVFEYDYESQQILKSYLSNLEKGYTGKSLKESRELMENMGKYGGDLVQTVKLLSAEAKTYADVELSYELEYRHVVSNVTYTNVITNPFVPDKKTYPIRWLIVLVVDVAALVLALILITFLDRKSFSDS